MDVTRIRFEVNLTKKDSLKIEKFLVTGLYGTVRKGNHILFLINQPKSCYVVSSSGLNEPIQTLLAQIFTQPFFGVSYNRYQVGQSTIKIDESLLPVEYKCIGVSAVFAEETIESFTNESIVDDYLSNIGNHFMGRRWVRTKYSDFFLNPEYELVADGMLDSLPFRVFANNLIDISKSAQSIKLFDTDVMSYPGVWNADRKAFEISDKDAYRLICFESSDSRLRKFIVRCMTAPQELFNGENFFNRMFTELKEKRQKEFVSQQDYYVPGKAVELVSLGVIRQWYVIETKLLNDYTHFK